MSKLNGILTLYFADKNGSTPSTYVQIFRTWIDFLGSEEAVFTAGIDQSTAYVGVLRTRVGIKPRHKGTSEFSWNTMCKYMAALRGFYKYLIRKGHATFNPFDGEDFDFTHLKQKVKKRGTIAVPQNMILRLIHSPDTETKAGIRDRGMLALLFYCALRAQEASNLVLADFGVTEMQNVFVTLRNTKSQKEVTHRIPDEGLPYILDLIDQRVAEGATVDSPLLVAYRGRNQNPVSTPFHRSAIHEKFQLYCQEIGLKGGPYSPHSARKSGITKAWKGLAPMDVKKYARHSSLSMTEHYNEEDSNIDNAAHAQLSFQPSNILEVAHCFKKAI